MKRTTLAMIAIAVIVIAAGGAVVFLVLPKPRTPPSPQCPGKDNALFIVYYSVPPNEDLFSGMASWLSNVIASNSSKAINVTLSVCSVSYANLGKDLKAAMGNRTFFPVIGIHTTSDLTKAKIIQILFDKHGDYYVLKEDWVPILYVYYMAYVEHYVQKPVLKLPNVSGVAETFRAPKLLLNETPVIGSPSAKYYLVIYEDVYCPYCAKFYADSLPTIEELVKNNTFAIVLKNFIVHGEATPMHRNITAMYLATQNSAAVLEVMKTIYGLVEENIYPSADQVADIVRSVTGYTNFNTTVDAVDKVIAEDTEEGWSYGVYGTPGLLIWSRERGRGVVIVGYATAENLLKIARTYLS